MLFWRRPHEHRFIPVAVDHANVPPPKEGTGLLVVEVGGPLTHVVARCECGEIRAYTVRGTFAIEDFLGIKPADQAAKFLESVEKK